MKTHVVENWTTADNQKIPFDELTHQHWSNIYWYHFIFSNKPGMSRSIMVNTSKMALQKIKEKFDGKILDWKPVYWFEIRWIQKLEFIIVSGVRIKNRTEIFHYDKKIGDIVEEDLKEVQGII